MHAGIKVKEMRSEHERLAMIARERSQNNSPKIPGRRKNGIKTIIVVMHELMFDFWTFNAPKMIDLSAVFFGDLRTFSITIIDVSTIIPMEIEIPESENRFIVLPARLKTVIENKMHSGIVSETMSEIFMLLKNTKRIKKVMSELMIAEIYTRKIEFFICFEISDMM